MHVLLLEDDEEIRQWICKNFETAGHVVDWFDNGPDALFAATKQSYDVLILDRMVPELDGLSLLKALRSAKIKTPTLMLTAVGEVQDRVDGLEAGADDYLVKPFASSELLARVVALGRRGEQNLPESTGILTCEDLELNLIKHTCHRGGESIDLNAKEIRLLEVLMRNKGRVMTRTMLLERVWGINFEPETSVVETHVSRLRAKIDKPFATALIRTKRGAGYVLGS
jgi:DNA-binding response OmpR family regulator